MKADSFHRVNHVVAALAAVAALVLPCAGRTQEASLTHVAEGRFEVTLTPASPAGAPVSRMKLDKRWSGALEGGSTGEMLSVGAPASGDAGYVAMERFTGTLDGRRGGFALQHSGVLEGGRPTLRVTVVPGSGSGALTGLKGEMTIDPSRGHAYALRYTLPGG